MNKGTLPQFAVVGRVNEGKSSVVATLTENDRILVGPDPGTTRVAERFAVRGDGHDLFTLIDTPGFEEPERVLAWLQGKAKSASERPAAVRQFVETFRHTPDFVAECELLAPIMNGAAVIYIVSSNHPYRPGYEAEMEILRWTGAPRLALINQGLGADYSAEWKRALGQFFNLVKVFDAHRSSFADRIRLLDALRVVDDGMAAGLERAGRILLDIQKRRLSRAVEVIADVIEQLLTFKISVSDEDAAEPNKSKMIDEFYDKLRLIENEGRATLEQVFRFSSLIRTEGGFEKPIFEKDLFAKETWEFLGQPKWVLISLGALAGGVVGGAVDAKSAGLTGFVAAPVGAIIGAAGVAGAVFNQPEAKILGVQVAGKVRTIGPHLDPNFPWIVLDRALLHFKALTSRTHALRDSLAVPDASKAGLVRGFSPTLIARLKRVFQKMQKGDFTGRSRDHLVQMLKPVIHTIAVSSGVLPPESLS